MKYSNERMPIDHHLPLEHKLEIVLKFLCQTWHTRIRICLLLNFWRGEIL